MVPSHGSSTSKRLKLAAALLQLDNEFGYVDWAPGSRDYLRWLARLAWQHLGKQTILFTTDPPDIADRGTLPGDEILT